MGTGRTDEFRKDAVRIALTSGLTRRQVADDLGVGARSYTSTIDYTTGGDKRPTIDAVRDYIRLSQTNMAATRGVCITPEEAMRRRLLLPTRRIPKSSIPYQEDTAVAQSILSVIEDAKNRGFYSETKDHLILTEAGLLNRDAICWSLFSSEVLSRHQENGSDYLDQQRYLSPG